MVDVEGWRSVLVLASLGLRSPVHAGVVESIPGVTNLRIRRIRIGGMKRRKMRESRRKHTWPPDRA
jgi:hypothetical protein